MGHYAVQISWNRREGETFSDNRYSRAHTWRFDGGVELPASASPQIVPLPLSREDAVDPEEAFVASLSSCHMLWFLSIAAERGYVVERYDDRAEGVLEKNHEGRLAITEVTLNPRVQFSGASTTTPAALRELHHLAHEKCFIAASVTTAVRVAGID